MKFRYGFNIERIASDGRRITGVVTDAGELTANTYVLALGSYSPLLLKPLGIRLPVYPVKGYSITVPITDPGGSAGIHRDGRDLQGRRDPPGRPHPGRRHGRTDWLQPGPAPARRGPLDHVVTRPVPARRRSVPAEFWTGLRPMTPDGPPVIGGTPLANLYLNTGHGTLGWTMAAGSGRVLADMISGRRAEIDLEGMTLERYGARLANPSIGMKGVHA